MILKRPIPPRVRMLDGQVQTLSQCGLSQVLSEAAEQEGYKHWWAGEDLLVGVRAYLAGHRSGEIIEVSELEAALLTALAAIGRPEIARRLARATHEPKICLEALALQAEGLEMTFHLLLNQELDKLVSSPAPSAHFGKLQAAVQRLRGARRWTPSCETLKEFIIELIHTKIGESGRSMRLALTLR